jgi:hypothetical protein
MLHERRNLSARDTAAWILAPFILVIVIPSNEKIASNQVFFAAHGVSAIAWLVILLIAIIGLWLILFGIFTLIRRKASPRTFDITASVVMLLLTWFLLGNLLSRSFLSSAPYLGPIVGLALAVALTELSRRITMGLILMLFAGAAAAVPLVLTLIGGAPSTANELAFSADAQRPNVVWIISDELQYPLVMEQSGAVRPEFPNLQRLQEVSTTYTHAYATANYTDYAVPSQLNGIADVSGAGRDRMDNVRSGIGIVPGLGSEYSVVMESPIYRFECDTNDCASVGSDQETGMFTRFVNFAKDTSAVAGRVALAPPFSNAFPELDGKWRDFWSGGDEFGDNAEGRTVGKAISGIDSVRQASPDAPFFALWHTIRTHAPWAVDREGKLIYPAILPVVEGAHMVGSDKTGLYSSPELASIERRLWANAAIDMDRQLGQLLDYLEQNDLMSNTMIIFTSDHGAAMSTKIDRRVGDTLEQRWSEIAHVPLMVKDPHQTSPKVVTAPRSTGQIAQAVLDAAGATPSANLTLAPSLVNDLLNPPVFSTVAGGVATPWVYTGAPEKDPWTKDDLTPPDPKHPFAIGIDSTLIGKTVPAGYVSLDTSDINALPGESDLQLLVIDRPTQSCDGTKPGLVTGNGVVSGSVLWEQGRSATGPTTRGWAIVPKSDDYGIFCAVPSS